MPNERQHLVEQAVAGEQLAPQHRDGDAGADQRRQIEDRPVQRQAADALVQHHGHQQREGELERHRQRHIEEGDVHRRDELGIAGGDAHVVGGADPARVAQQVEIRERQIERDQRRSQRQPEEADQPGRQKQIARRRCSRQDGFRRLCGRPGLPGRRSVDQRIRHRVYPRASMADASATNCLAPSAGVRRPKPTCSLTRRSTVWISPAPRGGGGGNGADLVADQADVVGHGAAEVVERRRHRRCAPLTTAARRARRRAACRPRCRRRRS